MICFSYQSPGSLSLILQRVRFQAYVLRETGDIQSDQFGEFLYKDFGIPKIILVDGIHLVKMVAGMVSYRERLASVHLVVCDAQTNFINNGFGPDDAELSDRGIWRQKYRHRFQERFNRMLEKDVSGIPTSLLSQSENDEMIDKGKFESLLGVATEGLAQIDTRDTRQAICGKLTGVAPAKVWRQFLKTTTIKKRPLAQITKFLDSKDAKALGHAFADRCTYDTRLGRALEFANIEYKGKAVAGDLKFLIKILGLIPKTNYEGGFPMSRKTSRMREAGEAEGAVEPKPRRSAQPAPRQKTAAQAPAMAASSGDPDDAYADPDEEYSEPMDNYPDEGGDNGTSATSADPDDTMTGDEDIDLLDIPTIQGMLKRDPDRLIQYITALHTIIERYADANEEDVAQIEADPDTRPDPEDDDYTEPEGTAQSDEAAEPIATTSGEEGGDFGEDEVDPSQAEPGEGEDSYGAEPGREEYGDEDFEETVAESSGDEDAGDETAAESSESSGDESSGDKDEYGDPSEGEGYGAEESYEEPDPQADSDEGFEDPADDGEASEGGEASEEYPEEEAE